MVIDAAWQGHAAGILTVAFKGSRCHWTFAQRIAARALAEHERA
jgi:hypothetical protein